MVKIPLLDDVLKGLPDNARLRHDIGLYQKRIDELETEVARLKDDKRQLQLENQQLKGELNKAENEFDPIEIGILTAISTHDSLTEQDIADMLKLNLQRVRFHLTRLEKELRLIEGIRSQRGRFRLTQKGRQYLVDQKLL